MPREENIDIRELELDVNNPRIKRHTEKILKELKPGKKITEETLLLTMQLSASTESGGDKTDSVMTFSKLQNSIIENRGILNPILVKQLPENAYKCIEGNTRLAIYKMQNIKHPDDDAWKYIKCTVYDDITEEEENKIRLQSHLVPPRPWEPYSRAKYLNQLIEIDDYKIENIAGVCGMSTIELTQYLDTYDLMEKHYRPYCVKKGDEFEVNTFSGFFELIKKPSLSRTIVGLGYDYTDFSKWIHTRDKIKRLDHVRQLERILKNKEARDIFLNEGSTQALKVFATAGGQTNLQDATITQLMLATTDKFNTVPFFEMKTLAQSTSLLEDCSELISLCQQCIDSSD